MGIENHTFEPYIIDRYVVGHSFRFSDPQLLTKAAEYRDNNDSKLSIMFTMAHTYEFNDRSLSYDWNTVENFCNIISNHDDMWYATNGEVIEYLLAVEELKKANINSNRLENSTDKTIYLNKNGKIIALESGESLGERNEKD